MLKKMREPANGKKAELLSWLRVAKRKSTVSQATPLGKRPCPLAVSTCA
jgi:hypothetical protein